MSDGSDLSDIAAELSMMSGEELDKLSQALSDDDRPPTAGQRRSPFIGYRRSPVRCAAGGGLSGSPPAGDEARSLAGHRGRSVERSAASCELSGSPPSTGSVIDWNRSPTAHYWSHVSTAAGAVPVENLVQRSDARQGGETITPGEFEFVDEEVAFRTREGCRSRPVIGWSALPGTDDRSPVAGRGCRMGDDFERGSRFEGDVPTRRILHEQGRMPAVGSLGTAGQLGSVAACRSPSVTSVGQRALSESAGQLPLSVEPSFMEQQPEVDVLGLSRTPAIPVSAQPSVCVITCPVISDYVGHRRPTDRPPTGSRRSSDDVSSGREPAAVDGQCRTGGATRSCEVQNEELFVSESVMPGTQSSACYVAETSVHEALAGNVDNGQWV